MLTRLLFVLVSTVLFAALGILALRAIAGYDSQAVITSQDLLVAGAERIELDLERRARQVPELATEFATTDGLAQDLRAMANAVKLTPPSGKVPDRLQQRIDSVREKLLGHIAVFREVAPEVVAVTLVDDAGFVLVSTDASSFKVAGALNADAEPGRFQLGPLDGSPQHATLVADDGIRFMGAAGILLRNRALGLVVLEVGVPTLPRPPGAEALVLAGDKPVLGSAPQAFDPAALRDAQEPYLLIKREVRGAVPVVGVPALSPFFVDAAGVGVWAQPFAVFGAPDDVVGLVFCDLGATYYSGLAGLQVSILLVLILVWIIHVSIILGSGRRLRAGVERVSDFLGRVREQPSGDTRELDERALPRALGSLARNLNAVLGHGDLAALPRSPTVDEVLDAQEVPGPGEAANLTFEGIAGSGSIGVSSADDAVDGFESLGEVADAAVDELAGEEEQPHPEDLPSAPDVQDAIDSLGGDDAGSEPMPDLDDRSGEADALPTAEPDEVLEAAPDVAAEPAEVLGQAGVVLGEAGAKLDPVDAESDVDGETELGNETVPQVALSKQPLKPPPPKEQDLGDLLDEYASDATNVMELSPELMAAVNQTDEAIDQVEESIGEEPAWLADKRSVPPPSDAAERLAGANDLAQEEAAPEPVQGPLQALADEPTPEPVAEEEDPEEAHFRLVFEQFIQTRRECGEPTVELTYEKFAAKLTKSRDSVVAKHKCASVRFQVYVKNGKAALKAVPAR